MGISHAGLSVTDILHTVIEPDYDESCSQRRKRFKKTCSIQPSKHYPTLCRPPSRVSGVQQHPANLQSSSIPYTTIIIAHQQRPQVEDCIEAESSSANVKKRKRASARPQNNTSMPLAKRWPHCAHHPKIPSSPSSILPLGRPLAAAPRLPRLASGQTIPKVSVQYSPLPSLKTIKMW
jgi:hypothetical protein